MEKIIAYVLLILVGLTGCAATVPSQPIITYTPSNTTATTPVITPAANQTTNQTETFSNVTSSIYIHVSPPMAGNVSPSSGNYPVGTNVAFTATPADPYVFARWTYDYTVSRGGGVGGLGDNQTLNLTIGISENITASFVAAPTIWNTAVLYGEAHPTVTSGEYFIIAQQITGGPWGPDSISATYNESLVALIDRKYGPNPGNGPPTPGLGTANAWLLFKALKPGVASISLKQVMGSYSSLPNGWTVTIVGN
jgi:hypothetical protein